MAAILRFICWSGYHRGLRVAFPSRHGLKRKSNDNSKCNNNSKGVVVVERLRSHPSQTARWMGHPGICAARDFIYRGFVLGGLCVGGTGALGTLEFGEDEADAAYDVVGWGFVGCERKELDGEVAGVGAEDETAFVEVDEAEEEGGAAADGVERGLVGAVGGEGVVVTVEDCDGSGRDEGVHGGGLLGVGANGEETLPLGVRGGGADAVGVIAVEAGGGDLDGFDDGRGGDTGFVHGGGGGDDGDDLDGVAGLSRDGGL
jgi:hypothetical protein